MADHGILTSDGHETFNGGTVYRDIHISGNARVHLGNSSTTVPNSSVPDREVLIKSLSFPELDNRCNNIDPAIRDTCTWFLNHDAYREWQSPSTQRNRVRFLWLRGKPGSGKSTITKQAYLNAKNATTNIQDSVDKSVVVVGFFFNSRGNYLEKSSKGFYMSVLHQLLCLTDFESPQLLMEIQRKRRFMADGWSWTENELKAMFTEIVSKANVHITMYIDALDECESASARPLIDFLSEAISRTSPEHSRLKLCVSSRHYPNIHVSNCSTITVEDFNAHDISTYVATKLREVGHASDSLCDGITARCSGVFLWAVLVIQRLREALDDGEPQDMLMNILKSMPHDLEAVFSQLVESISYEERQQSGLLMIWVLFAQRPMKLKELKLAIAFANPLRSEQEYLTSGFHVSDNNFRALINKRSRGLVEVKTAVSSYHDKKVDEYTVQFIHESVREFLLHRGGLSMINPALNTNVIGVGHDTLGRACLNYLKIKELEGENIREIRYRSYGLGFADYAYTYLFPHAYEAEKKGLAQDHIVREFSDNDGKNTTLYMQWQSWYHDSYRHSGYPSTMLQACSHFGLLSCVIFILNREHIPTPLDERLARALWLAVSAGHESIVQELLQKDAARCIIGTKYASIIYEAMSQGYDSIAKVLLRNHIDIDSPGELGSPLLYAAMRGKSSYVELLLNYNANVHYTHEKYGDALLAATVEGHLNIVQILIHHGAKIKIHKAYADGGYARGATHALLEACGWGHIDVAKLLLRTAMSNNLPVVFYTTSLKAAQSGRHQYLTARIEAALGEMNGSSTALRSVRQYISDQSVTESDIVVPTTLQSRKEITVMVKTLTGKVISIKIRQNLKCVDLKTRIQDREGLMHEDQYLVFVQRWISEQEYLSDRGICDGSRIDLLLPIWRFRRTHR